MSSPVQPSAVSQPAEVASDSSVDRINLRLADLDSLDGVPLAEHADTLGALHDELRAALAEIDCA